MNKLLTKAAPITARILGPRLVTSIAQKLYPAYTFLKHGDPYYFQRIGIQTHTYCSRRCWYCALSRMDVPNLKMSDVLFDTVVERIREIDWQEIVFFGVYDEPTADDRLPDMIAKLKTRVPKCVVLIFSNGDFLTERLAAQLHDLGVWRISVTEHKPFREEWQTRMARVRSLFPNMVNVTHLQDTLDNMNNHGGMITEIPGNDPRPCHLPHNIVIRQNGNVCLCWNDALQTVVVGNVERQGLEEIYANPKWVTLRRDLRRGIRKLPMCKKCKTTC